MTVKTNNEIGWKKHPRPQLRRGLFHMIEEGWRLNGRDICVPFPPQAPLSGYQGDMVTRLCYEVSFVLPKTLQGSGCCFISVRRIRWRKSG